MGIQIEQGLYIARIVPGSTVAKEGMLSTGDRIICVSIDRQTWILFANQMKVLKPFCKMKNTGATW